MTTLTDDVRALFDAANYAALATLLPDGSPHAVTVWAGVEDDRLFFFTQPQSRKARNIARDARVALTVHDRSNPYRTAWVRGRVVATREGEEALRGIDALSRKYTGADFPMRSGVVYLVEPERTGTMVLPFTHEPETADS
ncbi:MAG TPA: PPOX class F420-dependent oxidoreductase [Solirubrobacteraceae bacterium]|nr:PPOX class F420-dependent oxidoreductase [Solirubrobacteraceae bacterium]